MQKQTTPLTLTLPVKVKYIVNGVEMFSSFYYLNEDFFDSVDQQKVLIQ